MPTASEPSASQETVAPQTAPVQEQPAEVSAPAAQPEAPAEAANNTPVESQAQNQDSTATQENNGSLKDTFNSGVQNVKDA